jgi:hypothetical protein
VREAGCALLLDDRSDVDPVRRRELLRLVAGEDLAVVEVEPAPQGQPRVVREEGGDAVVAVGVDRPVGEERVRLLLLERPADLGIPRARDLRRAVDL